MTNVTLPVFRVRENAELPELATAGSACFDLRAHLIGVDSVVGYNRNNVKFNVSVGYDHSIIIRGGDRLLIPTGLIFDIPEGYSVRFHPRSGASLKQGLILANCEAVIDSDYINESMVLLTNISDETHVISHSDRICQAELVRDLPVMIIETTTQPTQKTTRSGGLGHTGKQ